MSQVWPRSIPAWATSWSKVGERVPLDEQDLGAQHGAIQPDGLVLGAGAATPLMERFWSRLMWSGSGAVIGREISETFLNSS